MAEPPAGGVSPDRGEAALLGIYGGSFDPVHLGHVATAEELLARFPLAEIRFLPAARSPLKPAAAPDQHRLAMLQLALQGKERLTIDTREFSRPPPSYSIETLAALRRELGPAQPLAFILGLDSFLELPRWRDWQRLTDHAHLLVVSRPGSQASPSGELAAWLGPRQVESAEALAARPGGRVLQVRTAPHDVASRAVRTALRAGKDTSRWLAPAVRDYIEHHHLYCGDAAPQ